MRRGAAGLARTVAFAAAILVGAPAAAQLPEMPVGKWWKRPRIAAALKLSAEQQQRLDDVFSKNRRTFIDLRADVERRQVDVEELLAKKSSDPKQVASATEALEQAKARLGKARTMMIVEMKEVLTEDQWKMIVERTEESRRERMQEMRERFGGRPRRGKPDGRSADAEPPE